MTSLRPLVANHLGVDEGLVAPDASFRDDLGADDLDIVELIMLVEDAFDIRIEPEHDEPLKEGTYGRLEALVAEKCAAKEACGG